MKISSSMVFIFILMLGMQEMSSAQEAGKIVKYEGIIKVFKGGGARGNNVTSKDYVIEVKDLIKTKKGAEAFITLSDGTNIILKENSVLEITEIKKINFENGKVLFNIKKQKDVTGVMITARSVVIGVKGTQFLVDADDKALQIFLKEGTLDIEAIQGEFEKYTSGKEGFENYKKEELGKFDDYEKKMDKEFKEFVKQFELGAGKAVTITGNEVKDVPFSTEIEDEFKPFGNWDSDNK